MLVVADSSPLIALVNIDCASLLPKLFNEVFIPPQIASELASSIRPQAVRDFIAKPPGWLVEKTPVVVEPIARLDAGELAAISLARELGADLLLIDEKLGRKAAAERHLRLTGTLGVLELAADRGFVDLADAFARIKRTDFWISPALLDERLARFRLRTGEKP